jgi:hypothetical protein
MSIDDIVLKYLGIDLKSIRQLLKAVAGLVTGWFQNETRFFDAIFRMGDAITKARQQFEDFKDWKPETDKLKNGVINLPIAKQHIIDLKDSVVSLYKDKFTTLETQIKTFISTLETKQPPSGGAEEDAGTVANVAVKVEQWVGILNQLADLMNDILDFTQMIDDLKKRILAFEDLVLSQGKGRKRVYLSKKNLGEGSINERV